LRTAVYVDGFNLFYRALRGSPYRWLDLLKLSEKLLQPHNKVVLVRYFTARVNSTFTAIGRDGQGRSATA